MQALLLGEDNKAPCPLIRASLDGGHDEKWLQALLNDQPGLIPIERIDPGAGGMIPVCRELPIPKEGSTVFLDLLGVTKQGRLVLVECKLWRNPQARREVVAQILEYAALLRRWSYGDLTARLKAKLNWSGANPLFEHVQGKIELGEADFVDAVSRSLKAADFDLIIAGDGIRSDLEAIAAHLDQGQGLNSRLALVEFQLWRDAAGRALVIPQLPLRTEVIRQRVIVDQNDVPLRLVEATEEADEAEALVDPARAASRGTNRDFWQRFIETTVFDHPDQPPARHGGNNWVKLDLPPPARWLTAYRTVAEAGLFLTLAGEEGATLFDALESAQDDLRQETGLDLVFSRQQNEPFKGTVGVVNPLSSLPTDDAQRAWLATSANRLVSAIRMRGGTSN